MAERERVHDSNVPYRFQLCLGANVVVVAPLRQTAELLRIGEPESRQAENMVSDGAMLVVAGWCWRRNESEASRTELERPWRFVVE